MDRLTSAASEITELVALIDRLESLLDRSDLSELELEVGSRTLILRTPGALASAPVVSLTADVVAVPAAPSASEPVPQVAAGHAIPAPLTGVFYHSPSPGAEVYVHEGDQVTTGQVIGLIEAMKLFNEIKSDVTGTVHRLVAGDGDLVKAKETLIEVNPA